MKKNKTGAEHEATNAKRNEIDVNGNGGGNIDANTGQGGATARRRRTN